MTDSQIARLQKLNGQINQLKREIKDMLSAPVVASIYDEEAQQYGEVARLAQLCQKRQAILAK